MGASLAPLSSLLEFMDCFLVVVTADRKQQTTAIAPGGRWSVVGGRQQKSPPNNSMGLAGQLAKKRNGYRRSVELAEWLAQQQKQAWQEVLPAAHPTIN
jgi:hypothetical protein